MQLLVIWDLSAELNMNYFYYLEAWSLCCADTNARLSILCRVHKYMTNLQDETPSTPIIFH